MSFTDNCGNPKGHETKCFFMHFSDDKPNLIIIKVINIIINTAITNFNRSENFIIILIFAPIYNLQYSSNVLSSSVRQSAAAI